MTASRGLLEENNLRILIENHQDIVLEDIEDYILRQSMKNIDLSNLEVNNTHEIITKLSKLSV